MMGFVTTGGGDTAGLRSGSGALVGPAGVLDVAGGRTTRLGWSDSGKLVALPRTAGGEAVAVVVVFCWAGFCGAPILFDRFAAGGGLAAVGAVFEELLDVFDVAAAGTVCFMGGLAAVEFCEPDVTYSQVTDPELLDGGTFAFACGAGGVAEPCGWLGDVAAGGLLFTGVCVTGACVTGACVTGACVTGACVCDGCAAGGLLVGLTTVVVFAELFAAGVEAGELEEDGVEEDGVEEDGMEEDGVEEDAAAGALVTCVVLVALLPAAGLLAGVAVWLCAGCALVAVGAAFDCAVEAAAAARSWFQTASLPPFSRYLRKESLAICCSLGVPFARFTALASSQYASALLPLLAERIASANP
jgi:hypothetical protein